MNFSFSFDDYKFFSFDGNFIFKQKETALKKSIAGLKNM